MNSEPPASPENDPNLSDLGRAMLGGDSAANRPSSKPSAVWEPPTADELHKLLPQYEIVKMLGRGGMGAVYMGRQISLDRPVAIKILSATLGDADVGFSERFKNEARAMAKLNHPGIVSVYDFGETEGGLLYIVMEYVDGTDVARMIAADGRLHTEHAMAITAHVCDALAYAHERGIIHRDIKPANIMVGYDGGVKVADFGLAKVSTANGSTMGLTQSGMAMGTLHFMAPEALVLGSSVDHRADIYAVGVMLYQMLTGKLPHGMFRMPSQIVSGMDPRYDGVIAKAIMEDRDSRYQSAREMRTTLDGILTQPVIKMEASPAGVVAPPIAALPSQARPQRPHGRPTQFSRSVPRPQAPIKHSLAWVWMLLLLLAAGGVWLFMSHQSQPVAVTPPKPALPPPAADVEKPLTPPPTVATPVLPKPPTVTKTETITPPAPVPQPVEVPQSLPPPLPERTELGWNSLFNGKDLTGWQPSPKEMPVTVSDGILRIRGVDAKPKGGLLYYQGSGQMPDKLPELKDCEVEVTLKTIRQGNSGLRFHVQADRDWAIGTNSLLTPGIEVQLWNEGVMSSFEKSYQTGSLFGIAPVTHTHFRDDEWFVVRLRLEGKNVQVFLRKESDTTLQQVVNWTEPADWTPPRGLPNARLGKGTLAFSNWVPAEGETWIKDVKIRPLQSADPIVQTAKEIASPTLWIDSKGRSLQAKFVRVEGRNVIVNIGGRSTPISLASLSAASQEIAQNLHSTSQASVAADKIDSVENSLLGLWEQRNDGNDFFNYMAIFEDGSAGFAWLKKGMGLDGRWKITGDELHVTWPNGCIYRIDLKGGAAKRRKGAGIGGTPDYFTFEITHTGLRPSKVMPTLEELEDASFDFSYKAGSRGGSNGVLRLLKGGGVVQQSPMNITGWKISDGYLMLMDSRHECQTLLNDFEKKNGKWSIRGQFILDAAVEHRLEQQ